MTEKRVHLVAGTGENDHIDISSFEEEERLKDLVRAFSPSKVFWGPVKTEKEESLIFPNQLVFLAFLNLWNEGWRKK